MSDLERHCFALPADILDFVDRHIVPADRAGVRQLLLETRYDGQAWPGARLLRCMLFISGGTEVGFRKAIALMLRDYRDLIMAAEYEEKNGYPILVRDLSRPFERLR